MAYIVTEPCIACKFSDCVATCPVDAFREGVNMLVIDPVECIDCQACVPACPVNAIFFEDDVPANQREFIALNAKLAASWPIIRKAKKPLPEAESMKAAPNKRKLLIEKAGG